MQNEDADSSAVFFDVVGSKRGARQKESELIAKSQDGTAPAHDRMRITQSSADAAKGESTGSAAEKHLPATETFGLALSGGGIRSATFSLGVLQALATNRLLTKFDYLSTVSGGGYLGAWLSAWIYRQGGDVAAVSAALAKNPATGHREPDQVQWLRRYSNYLTPRVGALSMDALTVMMIWLRNVILNVLILVAVVAALLLLPKIALGGFSWLAKNPIYVKWGAAILAVISLSAVVLNLTLEYFVTPPAAPSPQAKPATGYKFLGVLKSRRVLIYAILPGFLACVIASCWLFVGIIDVSRDFVVSTLQAALSIALCVTLLWLIALFIDRNNRKVHDTHQPRRISKFSFEIGRIFLLAMAGSVATFVGVLIWSRAAWSRSDPLAHPSCALGDMVPIMTFGPPLLMLCCGAAACLWIGLVGRSYAETSREWLSRAGGAFLLCSLVWLIWFVLAFYVPLGIDDLLEHWIGKLASLSWLGSLLGSVFMASHQQGSKQRSLAKWQTYLITLLTSVVAVGVFVAIAYALDWGLGRIAGETAAADYNSNWRRYDAWASTDKWIKYLLPIALGVTTLVALVLAWRVDINRFSLHNMYKNRLIRCYLGASNKFRQPQPFTGFDPADDIPLAALATGGQKPFHIINTALNLVQGSELGWQQRKAASFVLTPAYCGFELASAQGDDQLNGDDEKQPGFRATEEYASEDEWNNQKRKFRGKPGATPSAQSFVPDDGASDMGGMMLGSAIATSGAAVSPNMGAQSQPALAVLMTFLNIRLGRWSPNPARGKYCQASPRFGLGYLFAELLGFTNEKRDFVYLSDGGHFENLGVYELVRRECRRIVVVDAGADPQRSFEDLGNMLRKCRVDFGVEIDLPLAALYGGGDDNRSGDGSSRGKIHYAKGAIGEILLIKPSLCTARNEPADIFNYASSDPSFPQQTTIDQWFDESQFESYRKLGYDLAESAIKADALATVKFFI